MGVKPGMWTSFLDDLFYGSDLSVQKLAEALRTCEAENDFKTKKLALFKLAELCPNFLAPELLCVFKENRHFYSPFIGSCLSLDEEKILLIFFSLVGDIELLKSFLYEHRLETLKYNETGFVADICSEGHLPILLLLLDQNLILMSEINCNEAFNKAVIGGKINVVRFFLDFLERNPTFTEFDPAHDRNDALCQAAKGGHIDIVKLLLHKKESSPSLFGSINPADYYSMPFVYAAENGHLDILEFFLECKENDPELYGDIDPADGDWCGDNLAIMAAQRNGHTHVVDYLLEKAKENPELYGDIELNSFGRRYQRK